MPGVHYVLTGDELAAATDPLMNGLDTPKVQRHPLAVGQVRYAGEWVAAVVADSRALAEDALENVHVSYEPLPFVTNAEKALKPDSPPVHAAPAPWPSSPTWADSPSARSSPGYSLISPRKP